MSTRAEVSGKAFLGLIKVIKEDGGAPALERVVAQSGLRERFAQRLSPLGWYPYDEFVAFLRAADNEVGAGDLAYCRDLGMRAGKRDLNTIYKLLLRLASPERLIKSCTRVWEGYYRGAGAMEPIAWEPSNTILRIVAFPDMDPAHCRLMEGWMLQAMDLVGATVSDDAQETECVSRGGTCHEFWCRWTR